MDSIESAIRAKLSGDSQRNALDFLSFLHANGWQLDAGEGGNGEGWAFGGVVGKSLGYLLINGAPAMPGPWTIWFNTCDFGGASADEGLKEIAWAHASPCGRCHEGWKNCGGGERTIFGKTFDALCHSPLMFTDPDADTLSAVKQLAMMGMRVLEHDAHPVEKLIRVIPCKGCAIEVVERPDVLWVGCVDYAANNRDESDIQKTLKRYREELISIPKQGLINPDWSAALSINYKRGDKPCGIMFAQETYTDKQDERYDLFTQPGGLWMRIRNDSTAATRLLGKDKAEPYEYFAEAGILQKAAEENGYMQNPDVPIEIEYHCHAEYAAPPHTNYAYIPIIKKA